MAVALVESYGDLLAALDDDRRAHSLAMGRKVEVEADMTPGPQGQKVTVEDRLDEICPRYGPGDVITHSIGRARPVLLAAGQSPVGSIQVRS
jgi:hypothetical protein